MKAIIVEKFGGPEVLRVKDDVPIPSPKENEVLIKVGATGVNPLETYIRSGQFPQLPALPYTPGTDMCGTVEAVGANVKKFQVGDKVCSFLSVSGTYAEYSVVNHIHLLKVPNDYDVAKGAAVGIPYITAYRALFQKGNVKPGQTILIHGASGGAGLATAQMALSRGISVIGTAGTEEGMEVVKKIGVQRVFNHRVDGYTDQILKSTEGQGVDAVVEMLANVNLVKDLELLKQNGVVLIVGSAGSVEINPLTMLMKETNIHAVGMLLATDEEFEEASHVVSAGLSQGWLDPVVETKYSLDQAQQAHDDIAKKSRTKGKLVIVI